MEIVLKTLLEGTSNGCALFVFWDSIPLLNKFPYWRSFLKNLLFSFHYFYFIFSQSVKLINHLIYFFVGGGDLGGEGVAGCLVLGEVVFPLVLLDEGEANLLFLQLGQQCGKVGLIETLQGGGDFLHAQLSSKR